MTLKQLKTNLNEINAQPSRRRSAWGRGVASYSWELLDTVANWAEWHDIEQITTGAELEKIALNGADSWSAYSWGGSSLIYNGDIAETLCTPSELKRTDNGNKRPNAHEEWLDTQARALFQACDRLKKAFRKGATV